MNSEIVNSVLYHGTSTSFSEFSLSNCGSKSGVGFPLGYLGVYFTPCAKLASDFAKNKWNKRNSKYKKGAHVIPVRVKPKKVAVISPLQWLRYSGSDRDTIISIRKSYLDQGVDCLVIERSDTYCSDELYVPQVVALDASIIHYALSGDS